MPDLYDRLREDPRVWEQVENTLRLRAGRGMRFQLPPVHLVAIPDREILRRTFAQRYGVEDIDTYYIPIVLDRTTYRRVAGLREPTIGDYLSKDPDCNSLVSLSRGQISSVGSWYIGHISVTIPTDMAIEHEGIHAVMFRKNPHYRVRLLGTQLFAGPRFWKDHGWIEAVPYVATTDDVDAEFVFERYIGSSLRASRRERLGTTLLAAGMLPVATLFNVRENPASCRADIPYAFAANLLKLAAVVHHVSVRHEDAKSRWVAAFDLAKRLKQRYGPDGLVRLASEHHERDLMRFV